MRIGAREAVHSIQRAALLALFALASHVLLPYVHVLSASCTADTTTCSSDSQAPAHSPECGVCASLAHGGARAADAPVAVAAISVPLTLLEAPAALPMLAPSRAPSVASARGPPAASLFA